MCIFVTSVQCTLLLLLDAEMNKCVCTIKHIKEYHICSHNLRTLFPILATEKSGCVKYADFFCGSLDLGFILV